MEKSLRQFRNSMAIGVALIHLCMSSMAIRYWSRLTIIHTYLSDRIFTHSKQKTRSSITSVPSATQMFHTPWLTELKTCILCWIMRTCRLRTYIRNPRWLRRKISTANFTGIRNLIGSQLFRQEKVSQ